MTIEDVVSKIDELKLLSKLKNKPRSNFINNTNKELIHVICECCENILNGNVMLDKYSYDKLRKYKSTLRKLIKKSNYKKKKNLIVQKGGFLPIILPAIITGLSSIVASAIK